MGLIEGIPDCSGGCFSSDGAEERGGLFLCFGCLVESVTAHKESVCVCVSVNERGSRCAHWSANGCFLLFGKWEKC